MNQILNACKLSNFNRNGKIFASLLHDSLCSKAFADKCGAPLYSTLYVRLFAILNYQEDGINLRKRIIPVGIMLDTYGRK